MLLPEEWYNRKSLLNWYLVAFSIVLMRKPSLLPLLPCTLEEILQLMLWCYLSTNNWLCKHWKTAAVSSRRAGVIHLLSTPVKMELEAVSTQFHMSDMPMACWQSLDHIAGSSYKGVEEFEFSRLHWGGRTHNKGFSHM